MDCKWEQDLRHRTAIHASDFRHLRKCLSEAASRFSDLADIIEENRQYDAVPVLRASATRYKSEAATLDGQMAWTDEQLELMACAADGGWYIDAGNFSMVADFVKRGYLIVSDADEGSVVAAATESAIKMLLNMKILVNGDHAWSGYEYGDKHPAIVKREAAKRGK